MSFLPIIPMGGFGGWKYLTRTAETQRKVFEAQSSFKREEDYFRANIGKVKTAEALMSDRRLLKVALEAHGLEADLNSRFFVQKVLTDGTLDPKALAMRLSDKRYREFSAAFGFGDTAVPNTAISDFADKLLIKWKERRFEVAVGQVNNDMQLAMNAKRELGLLAKQKISEATAWYTIMGQPPLRKVFETAYGLPAGFGALDVERQKDIFTQKSIQAFGESSVAQFSEPEKLEKLVQRFLTRAQIAEVTQSTVRGSGALSLLTQMAQSRRGV